MKEYDHKNIEKKWQAEWERAGIYKTAENSEKPKQFILDMFPYPSGVGLHVGHPRGYIATDIYSRMKRMMGFNVLHPMGWDAFGLPAENFAIKNKVHPRVAVEKNIKSFKDQLSVIGFDYDWSREIYTTDPNFYKWTQWIFLQMYKKGLAYESFEPINWCPTCKTGLANEDLNADGTCEICGTKVEKKPLRQWVLKITDYADRMLADLDRLPKWPDGVKEAQRHWIGRSEGSEIEFGIKRDPSLVLPEGEGEMPRFFTTDPILWKALKARALEMRHNPTKAEEILWQALRRDATGEHFRRQQIVGKFVADFVCLKKKLVVEVDGDIHDYKIEEDKERTEFFNKIGFEVIRFRNEEIENNLDGVVKKIIEVLRDRSNKVLSFGEDLGGVKVFTTRADTLFGVTYVVLAPEHELISKLKSQIENWAEIEKYVAKTKEKSEIERTGNKEKTGVEFKGVKAINPANGEEVSVWIADYVLAGYGTGAVMAVPAHDERDFEFAKKYSLPLKEVIERPEFFPNDKAYIEDGIVKNSVVWMNGLLSGDAREEIISELEYKGLAKEKKTYRLRDWVFSRQRYWGEPIPIIHCEKCGVVPVPEKDLPVLLPEVEHYEPTGTGESPLADISEWVNVKCPTCGGEAKRETNTMPQWAGSSWYYLRYIDPKNSDTLVDKTKEKSWMPVNIYCGADHATRHLIYVRFWHKFLFDIGVVSTEEPFPRLEFLGYILAENGKKFSKREGNGIDPVDVIKQFGADAFRLYEMFIGPFEKTALWNMNGMVGTLRFIEKVWRLGQKVITPQKEYTNNLKYVGILHKTIKKVGEDIEEFKFNTAVSTMMICMNELEKEEYVFVEDFKLFLQLLAPFAPHMTEELWSMVNGQEANASSIHLSEWPQYDEKLIVDDMVNFVVQINGKVRTVIPMKAGGDEDEVKNIALNNDEVKKWVDGKEIVKYIFIKDKILNIVVHG